MIGALELQLEVVGRVEVDALELASPCAGWTVRDVLRHSIGVTRKFTQFATGATSEPHTPTGDLLAPDHRTAMGDTLAGAAAAWATADLARTCTLPFGTFRADVAAGINLFDVLTHTWDIATPTGIGLPLDDDLWVAGLDAACTVIGPVRDGRHYAPEVPVPEDAPAMLRLVAFLGRTP